MLIITVLLYNMAEVLHNFGKSLKSLCFHSGVFTTQSVLLAACVIWNILPEQRGKKAFLREMLNSLGGNIQ